MKLIISIFLTITFFGLALIHFYWASGGQWGFDAALPTNEQGIRILNPTIIDSIMVGIVLLLFGLFYLSLTDLLKFDFPIWIKNTVLWLIPIIFILRAIGDLKYVGLLKNNRVTEFANLDTMFYSPLCLVIGVIGLVLIKLK